MPTPTPPPAPSPAAKTFSAIVLAREGARVRDGAGLDMRVLAVDPAGTRETFDGWFTRTDDPPQADSASGRIEAWSRDWYHLADGRGWMHAVTVDSRPPSGMPPTDWAPPPPPSPPAGFEPVEGRRQILVSVSQQHLWAYNGTKLLLHTDVATGRPELPTPPGTYAIRSRFSPYTFVSPWPPGSSYWYPTAVSSYAMEFIAGGYFLHDAPWRTVWGPGANLAGTGTHGCVNVPLDAMARLYAWAQVGDVVIVMP